MSHPPSAPEAQQPLPIGNDVNIDLGKAQSMYINFVRVLGMPEEVVLDFALQSEPDAPIVSPQRISLSYLTAKRLFLVLQETLTSFEKNFGAVETEVGKRITTTIA